MLWSQHIVMTSFQVVWCALGVLCRSRRGHANAWPPSWPCKAYARLRSPAEAWGQADRTRTAARVWGARQRSIARVPPRCPDHAASGPAACPHVGTAKGGQERSVAVLGQQ